MEEGKELEEGEAYSLQEEDDDSCIDPDSLSYIDEKLQNVLGHFQRDFEGGVFTENLGANYGGYGSFLSTFQGSPSILSQPSPPKLPNPNSDEKLQNVLGHFQKDFEGGVFTENLGAKYGEYGSDFLPWETTMAPHAPVVIEESWVCCDNCHKWRLLPYGTDPDSLPKKWKCSSLDWLPGMNSCAVSEEETTRGLHALYVTPFPDVSATNHHILVSGDTSTGGVYQNQNITHNNQNLSSVANKNTVKDAFGHLSHSTGTPFSSFGKKNQQTTIKTRSLNDGDHASFETVSAIKGVLGTSSKL